MEERCWPIGTVRLSCVCTLPSNVVGATSLQRQRGLPPWLLSFLRIPADPLDLFHGYTAPLTFGFPSSVFPSSLPILAFVLFFPSIETEYLLRFVPPTRHPLRNMTFKPPGRWSVIVRWKAIRVNDNRVKIFSGNLKI